MPSAIITTSMYVSVSVATLENTSNQISENQLTTIIKSARSVAHDDRLTPIYLPVLGGRLVMELSYESSPLVPFLIRAQYTTTIPIISQR